MELSELASSRSAWCALLSAWISARALASTMSVDAPFPDSDLPSTLAWRNTCPTLSRPGVSERSDRLSTSIGRDRKSTRLNSSHLVISYAVFCLKKKNEHYELAYLDKQRIDLEN